MPVVHILDLHYLDIPHAIAAYVIDAPLGPVLIETGPASTVERLYVGLRSLGIQPRDIRHALVTHIHLDHAGAAGHLAQLGSRIYVHEFGAKHLVDPGKLVESATRIYGDQMDRLWGRIIPTPDSQITPLHDGDTLDIAGLTVRVIETPGHARHHHAFVIEDHCFVGDAAGITVPGVDSTLFLGLPTPPPEFDTDAWLKSVDRLEAEAFRCIYPTHFGRVLTPAAHLRRLRTVIREHEMFIRQRMQQGAARAEILKDYVEWVRREAISAGMPESDFGRYLSRNLLTMNVDGMIRWAEKILLTAPRAPAASGSPSRAETH